MTETLDDDTKIKAGYMLAGTLTGIHEKLDLLREGHDPSHPVDHNVEQAQIAVENAVMRVEQVLRHLTGEYMKPEAPATEDMLDYLTAAEIAEKLKVSKMTVYRMAEDGILPSYKVGRSIRITRKAFDDYLKGLQK